MEHVQKHNRIQPAGDGNQNGLAATQKLPGENGPFNGLNQVAHRAMLLTPTNEARIDLAGRFNGTC